MDGQALPGLGGGNPSDPGVVTLRSAGVQVASILRREIQRGDHAAGARLRQRDIAARLGVSTTPVREAFGVLAAEGFLVVESHRGAVVVQPTASDLREGYAIRGSLEALAIREAAAHFDHEVAPALRTLMARMQAERSGDKWVALDLEFHHRLNAMAGMPRLLGLIDDLRGGVTYYIEAAFDDDARRTLADREHTALFEACAGGDADRAEAVVRAHLEHAAAAVVGALDTDAPSENREETP